MHLVTLLAIAPFTCMFAVAAMGAMSSFHRESNV